MKPPPKTPALVRHQLCDSLPASFFVFGLKVLDYVKRNAADMSLLIITSEPNCQGFKIQRWGDPDRRDVTLSGLQLIAESWINPENCPF